MTFLPPPHSMAESRQHISNIPRGSAVARQKSRLFYYPRASLSLALVPLSLLLDFPPMMRFVSKSKSLSSILPPSFLLAKAQIYPPPFLARLPQRPRQGRCRPRDPVFHIREREKQKAQDATTAAHRHAVMNPVRLHEPQKYSDIHASLARSLGSACSIGY